MADEDYKSSWKIDQTDNHSGYPMGGIQKLKQIGTGDSYELKWKAGKVDCSLSPLHPDPADPNILQNPSATGFYGGYKALYNVRIELTFSTEKAKGQLKGNSQENLGARNSPAPLVGQWGAETPPPPGLTNPPPSRAVENDR